eukprot:3579033-Pyramimonas_sp.AAC.2
MSVQWSSRFGPALRIPGDEVSPWGDGDFQQERFLVLYVHGAGDDASRLAMTVFTKLWRFLGNR